MCRPHGRSGIYRTLVCRLHSCSGISRTLVRRPHDRSGIYRTLVCRLQGPFWDSQTLVCRPHGRSGISRTLVRRPHSRSGIPRTLVWLPHERYMCLVCCLKVEQDRRLTDRSVGKLKPEHWSPKELLVAAAFLAPHFSRIPGGAGTRATGRESRLVADGPRPA